MLGINNALDYFSCVVSFLRDALYYNVHYFRNQPWETLEDFLDNLACYELELLVGVLNEFQSWVSEFLELRINQVYEHIHRWEAAKTITLVHLNSLLNMHVCVLTCRAKGVEFLIQVVKVHFDSSSSRNLHIGYSCTSLKRPLDIVSSRDCVLVCLDEICDH